MSLLQKSKLGKWERPSGRDLSRASGHISRPPVESLQVEREGRSHLRLHFRKIILAMVLGFTLLAGPAFSLHSQGSRTVAPELKIIDQPIVFNEERIALTREYLKKRYGLVQDNIEIQPRMIVAHWTAVPTFQGSFAAFNHVRLQGSRPDIVKYSDLNVSIHFLVDRDGTVYRLMPETWMARHVIGLNWCAIGVENVGDGAKYPLTPAQLKANAALVRYLKAKYPPIEYLIGHFEYGKFRGTPLWKETDPNYFTRKIDPGEKFMRELRASVKDLGLKAEYPTTPK